MSSSQYMVLGPNGGACVQLKKCRTVDTLMKWIDKRVGPVYKVGPANDADAPDSMYINYVERGFDPSSTSSLFFSLKWQLAH